MTARLLDAFCSSQVGISHTRPRTRERSPASRSKTTVAVWVSVVVDAAVGASGDCYLFSLQISVCALVQARLGAAPFPSLSPCSRTARPPAIERPPRCCPPIVQQMPIHTALEQYEVEQQGQRVMFDIWVGEGAALGLSDQ